MGTYLAWKKQTITDFSPENISNQYADGFVFTRRGKGEMDQTRSVRIDLSKFELSSENRRVLKKTDEITLETIPLSYSNYHWSIGKLAKDFYTTKFGDGTFSANKVKELLTDTEESNFNLLLKYIHNEEAVGYSICYANENILHYSYPFYELTNVSQFTNIGIGMMTKAIVWSKDAKKKYAYLGSAQRPTDTYKFQFSGAEWFDGEKWSEDVEELKNLLTHTRNDADTLPEIIKQVGFDFHWDSKKVWALVIPTQTIDIEELTWHFDIPFWEKDGTDAYNLTPWEVINKKEGTLDHQKRVEQVDLRYPIDIMENKGKYVILDGLHRLVKAYILGQKEVQVRIIPRKNIPDIARN